MGCLLNVGSLCAVKMKEREERGEWWRNLVQEGMTTLKSQCNWPNHTGIKRAKEQTRKT